MSVPRIIKLCNNVEGLARELDRMNERGRGSSTTAVLVRMKLAALTVELISADLIERARTESPPQQANA